MEQDYFCSVYLTRFSICELFNNTETDFEQFIEMFNRSINEYSEASNIDIECVTDLIDFKFKDVAFEDILLSYSNDDINAFSYYLSEIEKVTTPLVKYKNSYEAISLIQSKENKPDHLAYPFSINNEITWPMLKETLHTYSWSNTQDLNTDFISKKSNSSNEFIHLSKKNFSFLDFHEDIIDTLKTIPAGNFLEYKSIISHALNTLNQSYTKISTDPNKNQDDLNIISQISSIIGLKKSLSCTRQGSSKVSRKFLKNNPKDDSDVETINCEYHLKINWNDTGKRLNSKHYIRVYFGLKSYEDKKRKQFKLAHIGKHL